MATNLKFLWYLNRPFPSSLVPQFQNEIKCETFHMKMSSACSFIFLQIKVIFIRMVSHLDSLWDRGTRDLGNGLLASLNSFGSKISFELSTQNEVNNKLIYNWQPFMKKVDNEYSAP